MPTAPTVSRVPSGQSTSSESTLSDVLPQRTECEPHALLPIIPPSVQRLCVDGSGPNVRPCGAAAARSRSSTRPGWTTALRRAGSSSTSALTCRDVSMTTPPPTALPATLVPPPRGVNGTPYSRQAATTATMSSVSAGQTTPSGTRR